MVITNLSGKEVKFAINRQMPPIMQNVFSGKMEAIGKNEKLSF